MRILCKARLGAVAFGRRRQNGGNVVLIDSGVDRAAQFTGDAALAHHQNAIANADEFRQFRGYDNDANAPFGQIVDQPINFGFGPYIDAASRLIENENPGIQLEQA